MTNEEALSLVRDRRVGAVQYRDAMAALGAAAAGSLSEERIGGIHVAHVVTGVEDYDGFTRGLVKGLGAQGWAVTVGTYWTMSRILCKKPWLDTATIVMAHEEPNIDASGILVASTAVLGAVSSTAARLMHVLDRYDFSSIHVASAVAHTPAEGRLQGELAFGRGGPLKLAATAYDGALSDTGWPVPGVGTSHFLRNGFETELDTLTYLPPKVEKHMNWQRRPSSEFKL